MLDLAYPCVRAFVDDCVRCGYLAMVLIASGEYVILDDGAVIAASQR